MTEDAQRALREIKDYDGQKISVVEAKKKLYEKKQGKNKKGVCLVYCTGDKLLYKSLTVLVTNQTFTIF